VRMENRFRHKDGSWRWLQWTMTENNGLIYVSGRHVTAEKEAAAALDRAQRQTAHLQKMDAIGQLTGGIAHDFNNLLMIVSGHAQSLKNRLKEPKDTRAVQAIEMAATRGENLTRQLLSFARTLPLNPTVINPAEAVGAIRDVLAGSMHVNIKFHIDMPDNTWPVLVDKSELELALINLAVNARDAMPHGGELSIETGLQRIERDDHPRGHYAWLRVTDTGLGIAPDILPRIFEPFFTTKQAGQGTGLGLATVVGIAEQHGGWVDVRSEPDRGASFQVFLPAHETAAERVAPLAPARGGDETILVVEDDVAVRSAIRTTLEHHGHRVLDARDGAQALELWGRHGDAIALVLTDLVLPDGTSGVELALRLQTESPAVRVVFMSGYGADAGTSTHVRLREGDNFAQKPFSPDQLLAMIRRQLDAS
jgi:signal transduction histidine kinase/ActR/RegA family two-component response regulator